MPIAAQQQNDMQTQDAKPFNGTIVKEKGKFVLKDKAANVSYQLDDQEKAKQFEGKQVKVTGKLDMNTNLIHVENIEPRDFAARGAAAHSALRAPVLN
jgi:hypothetical protein